MPDFWIKQLKPGYFIKYDGYRSEDKCRYTYGTPDGRIDVPTYEKAYELAVKDDAIDDNLEPQ